MDGFWPLLALAAGLVLFIAYDYLVSSTGAKSKPAPETPRPEPPRTPARIPHPDEFLEAQERKKRAFLSREGYLSYTSLRAYLTCPHHYYLRHVRRIRIPASPPQQVGKAVHAGIAYIHYCLLKAETLPSLQQVWRVYQKTLDKEAAAGGKPVNSYLHTTGKRILDAYLRTGTRHTRPREVEWGFRISADHLDLLGFIDLVTTDGKLVEYKTCFQQSPVLDQKIQDARPQLAAYTWAFRETTGEQERAVEVHFLLPSGVRSLPVLVTEAETREFRDTFAHAARKIRAGQFEPSPGGQCRTCPYKAHCEHWTGGGTHDLQAPEPDPLRGRVPRSWGNPPVYIRHPGGPRSRPPSLPYPG